jgi:hypothetical protein
MVRVLLFSAVLVAVVAGLLFAAIQSDNKWDARCAASHGIKRQYATTYILSGKTLIPVAEYECVSQDGKVLFQ